MRKIILTISLFSLAGLLTACGGGGSSDKAKESSPAPVKQDTSAPAANNNTATTTGAEAIFKQTCATCHGADLQGNIGPNLTKIGSKYSKDQILGIIASGRGAMPPGLLKGTDADAVATWLAAKK